ncbi:GNAT family N-acetyltransferase [Chryseobacterium tructae]|uniref:GNAT family N-acetyltransferase n=1 Tax=Chryseobacterium tructae TaxID=1037380 RepID=A0ABV7XY95_9FLAO|nr:GNAT family N-acetyltransferase [Chryseobacterium tructae]MDN3693727.1 GNAT family N-acetyltransferase [Chryseobacterium tructae]
MKNTPDIHTERLILRRFRLEDAEAFYHMMNDPEVNTYLPLLPFENVEEAEEYLVKHYIKTYENETGYRYAICLKTNDVPIGYINIAHHESNDLGYGLSKKHWHKGVVTEACQALLVHLRASNLLYITATHDIHNERSGNVMKKIGMKYCYSYEEQWQPKDILVTFRLYQLNLDGDTDRVYMEYWNRYKVHFIEENV